MVSVVEVGVCLAETNTRSKRELGSEPTHIHRELLSRILQCQRTNVPAVPGCIHLAWPHTPQDCIRPHVVPAAESIAAVAAPAYGSGQAVPIGSVFEGRHSGIPGALCRRSVDQDRMRQVAMRVPAYGGGTAGGGAVVKPVVLPGLWLYPA